MFKKYIREDGYYLISSSNNSHIPVDDGNSEYQKFMVWLDDNNLTIDDIEVANPPQPRQPEPDEKEIKYNSKTKTFVFKNNGNWQEVEEANLNAKVKVKEIK